MSERITSHSIKDSILGKKELVSLPGFGELTVIRPETLADVVDVGDFVEEYYRNRTRFNHAVIDFGNFFDGMKRAVPIEAAKRWGVEQPIPEEVTVLANDPAMNSMTRIANTPGAYEDPSLKRQYRASLEEALETIKSGQLLDPEATKIAVKRAGAVAAEILHGRGRALVYEGKRLPLIDGSLAVGMEDPDRVLTVGNLNGKNVEVSEVFLASGSTILGLMADGHSRGIKPESLTVVAPFATQQGAEAVLALSSRIGWQTRILTNRVYHWLNEHLYVLVTPEEEIWREVSAGNRDREVQAGGDAGDLTELN